MSSDLYLGLSEPIVKGCLRSLRRIMPEDCLTICDFVRVKISLLIEPCNQWHEMFSFSLLPILVILL